MADYELESVMGHYYKDGKLMYWCKWLHWPVAASTGITEEEMKRTAKELLQTYLKSVGVFGLKGAEKEAKLKETAITVIPQVEGVELVEVVSHTTTKGGKISFTTRWSNGELVANRPKSAFTEEKEAELLQRYMEHHVLASPSNVGITKKNEKSNGMTQDTSARTRGDVVPQNVDAILSEESNDGDVEDNSEERTDSDAAPSASKRARLAAPNNTIEAQVANVVRPAETPVAVDGRMRDAARAVGDAPSHNHIGFCKGGNGQMLVIFEGANGSFDIKEIDEAFRAQPQEIFNALKEKVFKNI